MTMKKTAEECLSDFFKKQKEMIEREKRKDEVKANDAPSAEIDPEKMWDWIEGKIKRYGDHWTILPVIRRKFAQLLSLSSGKIVCHHLVTEMDEQGVTSCAICRDILM